REGEIARLREIADPRISLITNVGHAHLEFLGSLEGVARAKGELWQNLRPEDWIAVNADDPRVAALAASARCRKKTYGVDADADIRAVEIETEEPGIRFTAACGRKKARVRLPAFGRHNVSNALAAVSVGTILGIDLERIASGLESFQPYSGRGRKIALGRKVTIIDEAYNSNPDSLEATLSAFREMKGKNRGILVLGDMLEVGPDSAEVHRRAGSRIGKMGFAHLFWMGDMGESLAAGAGDAGMCPRNIHVATDAKEILRALEAVLQEHDWVLVKGSRRMRLERIVEGLSARLGKE
ncbi:MAG TPA: UDP-N-acetylmuramoyl-tripeptide--D-alanyl-D-alanine ligase, partial [Thermodesulfobacteriota bacterium]|nr:UDP-N-acetylmuramoyl-tripeptide--D-alanyl-D-alanine ligase [Thermodesulfobacteriota bacterium]